MRASRLLSIMILLQLRGQMTADALAAEFEVSARTIYRDIDALSAAGVPVYGDTGPGGGFQLHEGYRTQLTGLTVQEAGAMMFFGLSEQAIAMGLGDTTKRARNKLLAAMPRSNSDEANRIAGRFHLDTVDWYRSARPVPQLQAVARAVLDQKTLSMTYQSWSTTRQWLVEPLGIVQKAGNWYLVACGQNKIRTFNVADIKSVQPTDMAFARPKGFELASWWTHSNREFEKRLRPSKAELRVSPLGLQRLRLLGTFAAEAVAKADTPDEEGWVRLFLPIETIEQAAPMLLGVGPEIEVIAPDELRATMHQLALLLVDKLKK